MNSSEVSGYCMALFDWLKKDRKQDENKKNLPPYLYDETEIDEALAELQAARKYGYEITCWTLVHDEDAASIL